MNNTYIKDYTNSFLINNHEYIVTAPARFDRKTDELVDDLELDDIANEIAEQLYRDDTGLVSPADIKKYRNNIKLTQLEFAKLLGWHQNTVALYEVGAFPSEADNKVLKALMKNNDFLSGLLADDDKVPDKVANRITAFLNGEN
ncbi:helix-turn-helix domain-containing protein [Secundilactobacillus paracollinoides]|uniref:helix-turn-helix domain-containing protein n=1 Tax=Secundilactobacillus paracollinoides TaxID=240427 RepID=UPI0006EF7B34|nr:helix-turn-helix domain-containing protein [Secundilactobacillus paracollinoides]KRL80793.1 hypothetical protein FC17_GL003167 [Secundilactobacillus paracollinoides DSM 15502 = JCM 11969]